MPRPSRVLVLLVVLAASLSMFAQTGGASFPLTNTRYGASSGLPLLRSNGQDILLFSSGTGHIRAAKLVEGQNRAGDEVFDVSESFDVAWLGTHFLAVTHTDQQTRIIGRRLDRDGHPIGAPFTILTNARNPRLAAGHGRVLLLYTNATTNETRATLLARDGSGAGAGVGIDEFFAQAAATASGFLVVSSSGSRVVGTTLDASGNIVSESTIAGSMIDSSQVAVASRDGASLVVWANYDEVGVTRISSAGVSSTPIVLDKTAPDAEPGFMLYGAHPSVVWNGSGWTVLYQIGYNHSRVRVAHLDALAQQVLSREDAPADTRSPSIALAGTRAVAAWSSMSGWYDPSYVSDLPLAQNTPREASFGAMEQYLVAAASSDNATFVAWEEAGNARTYLRVGVRTHDGQWHERELQRTSPDYWHTAASDGRNFLFLTNKDAWLLDESASPLRGAVALPRPVQFAVWNGEKYLLFSDDGVRTLTREGTLSAPSRLPIDFTATSAASDGNGIVVAGGNLMCQFLLCTPGDARAARLTRDLARVDTQDMFFADDIATLHGIVWNGAEYVVAWDGGYDASIARVPPAAGAPASVHRISDEPLHTVSMTATSDGNVALLRSGLQWQTVTFVGRDGAVKNRVNVRPSDGDYRTQFRLTPLPDGAVGMVHASQNSTAPHYGAQRLQMAVVSANPLTLPAAPQVSARDDGARALVDWSAPAGTVNGYRLEHRTDDGAWIELERWFGPGEQSVSIRKPSYGRTFAFRVRAISDAGAGPYSNVATAQTPKRRAIGMR